MRQVSLREFRTRGVKALKEVPAGETTLLVGQNGPAFFLVPVFGDVVKEDRELRRAMALASLREGWRLAEESGASLASDVDPLRMSRNALNCSRYQRNRLCRYQSRRATCKDRCGSGVERHDSHRDQSKSRGRIPGSCPACQVPSLRVSSSLVGVFD